jgi:hypothetical protein
MSKLILTFVIAFSVPIGSLFCLAQGERGKGTGYPAWARHSDDCSTQCSKHPKLSGACFTVHGRMNYWNGSPSVRIWIVGTKRIFGVSEGRFYEPGVCNLPQTIADQLDWEKDLFADFVVCPFTSDEPDVMRLVCVESASKIFVRQKPKR